MPFLGIDLGATNIAAALVDESSSIIRQASKPTLAGRPALEIIDDMVGLSLRMLGAEGLIEKDIAAIGVGIPGLVDPETGVVQLCPNLNWRQLPLKSMLQERLSLPIYITNDANCAALAELRVGAFQGRQSAVLITLGSGIGGGVILAGKLNTGAHGAAGEIGHLVVELDGELCACGNRGCFERYASAEALVRMYSTSKQAHSSSANTSMCPASANTPMCLVSDYQQMCTSSDKPQTAREIIEAAKNGEVEAVAVFEKYACNLARGIVSIINLFDPEIIALGGGVSQAGDFLLDAVQEEIAEHQFLKGYPIAEIVLAALGNEAGLIGAALYAQQERLKA